MIGTGYIIFIKYKDIQINTVNHKECERTIG